MKMKTTGAAIALTLGLGAAANAAVIAPGTITGSAADYGSAGDLVSGSGLSTTLTGGETLAAAQAATHTLTGTGHTVSWTNTTVNVASPKFIIDLGSDQAFGTVILWQYGNNGGPGVYDSGNHTRGFELSFRTELEGNDFSLDSAEFSDSMAYIDAGGDDSTATNVGQAFQFTSQNARYVELSIVSNWGGEIIDTNTVGGGDRYGLGEVRFATEAIPEPSSAALLGLGGLALMLRRRK